MKWQRDKTIEKQTTRKSRKAGGTAVRDQGCQNKGSSFSHNPYNPHWHLDGAPLLKDLCLLQDASPDSYEAELRALFNAPTSAGFLLIRDLPHGCRITSVYVGDLGV